MTDFSIGGRRINREAPPFLVLEAGINHNGELDLAFQMVATAKRLGADAVKFQTFRSEELVGDPTLMFTYRSQGKAVTESMLEMFRRYEFSADGWRAIKQACEREGITFLSTPQNPSDLDILLTLGVEAVKIGSDDFTNTPLLKHYARTKLPLILSCGMADMGEVEKALDAVGARAGYPTVLLVCTSQYPTPLEDANVARVTTLRERFPEIVVGFSDHTQGYLAAIMAEAMGAVVFEKHFTMDRNLPGPDHWFSENPDTAAEWVSNIRAAHKIRGSGRVEPTPAELEMRVLARRSIMALADIPAGEKLTELNVGLRRPGTGLPPSMLGDVIGRTAARAVPKGRLLDRADLA